MIRDKEERWHEAWRRSQMGQSTRSIGRSMGVSQASVRNYIKRWEKLLAGSDRAVAERDHQVAVLAELERRIWREAERGHTTWAAAAGPLRAVLSDKRDLAGVGNLEPGGGEGVEAKPGVLESASSVVDELDARRRKAS